MSTRTEKILWGVLFTLLVGAFVWMCVWMFFDIQHKKTQRAEASAAYRAIPSSGPVARKVYHPPNWPTGARFGLVLENGKWIPLPEDLWRDAEVGDPWGEKP